MRCGTLIAHAAGSAYTDRMAVPAIGNTSPAVKATRCMRAALTQSLAEQCAAIALGHIRQEYPNRLDQTLEGPQDLLAPSTLHPIFFGSYDWHSCVHSHWMLARLLRRFPDLPQARPIRAHFDAAFTPRNVAGECAYFHRPGAGGFKRPYGWAWLLKLHTELRALDARWAEILAPLADIIVARFRAWLPLAPYPVRVGTHFNTAFGLRLSFDHAEATGDAAFADQLRNAARLWYGDDRNCPAWDEPGGDDFLSPALIEAECLRRLLPEAFPAWFERFLPRLADGQPATLFRPAVVADRNDGRTAHLDGLNLSRAWCFRALAAALPAPHPARPRLAAAAEAHLRAALPHIADDYMGAHWLASFVVLATDEAGRGSP